MKKLLIASLACLVSTIAMNASAIPGWSATSTVKTIIGDACGGTAGAAVTAFYLEGQNVPYYFSESSTSAKNWLSMLETAMATGTPLQIKYETAANNPGAQCTFNPGFEVFVIAINP